jgi:ABC-type glutathione transport system ATPase component
MTMGEQVGLPTTSPLLEAVNVSKSYGPRRALGARHAVRALDNVTIEVNAGDRLAIVGESGSGKSTLARLFLALEEPTAGEVRFEGAKLDIRRKAALANLRRSVQIVFQDPLGSLDPRMSIGESVAEPLRALHVAGDHRARVDELLNAVGLTSSAARRYPHQFSGGQRQRVAIARALAPRPRVLVADEAVSALDVSVRAQVLNLIDDLVDRFGLTLVFISHDLAVVRHLCTRVAVLYRGRLVEQGPVEQIYRDPQHPYTRALLRAVPRLGGGLAPEPGPSDAFAPAHPMGG